MSDAENIALADNPHAVGFEGKNRSQQPAPGKGKNIHVAPAVLNAARTPVEELPQKLQTVSSGLTEAEAEERARLVGPNAVAQEKPQTWPIRLLKIIRNPLVILLTTLSSVSVTMLAYMVLTQGIKVWLLRRKWI